MLRRIREPFGKAGLIVAVVALVAALAGGAYAASGLNGQQKKEVKKIAKQSAGKDGAQGPAGAQGPKGDTGAAGANGANGTNGAKGDKGDKGENGKNGEAGKGVSVFPLDPENGEGTAGCKELGGAEITNGTDTAFACNGEAGEGGGTGEYPETLPSGDSMKGYWIVEGSQGVQMFGSAITTISFPLPLAVAPAETVLIGESPTEAEKNKCPGEAEAPKATPGVLCLYVIISEGAVTLNGGSPSTFGAGILFGESNEGFGSWAVKAP